jgi:hypothetical protein
MGRCQLRGQTGGQLRRGERVHLPVTVTTRVSGPCSATCRPTISAGNAQFTPGTIERPPSDGHPAAGSGSLIGALSLICGSVPPIVAVRLQASQSGSAATCHQVWWCCCKPGVGVAGMAGSGVCEHLLWPALPERRDLVGGALVLPLRGQLPRPGADAHRARRVG